MICIGSVKGLDLSLARSFTIQSTLAASIKRLDWQVVSLVAKLGGREYHYEMRCGIKEARFLGEGDDNRWLPVAGDEELIYKAVCTECD